MKRRELEQSLQDFFDGEIELQRLERLQEELRANPDARKTYLDYVHLENALQLRTEGARLLTSVPMDRIIERRIRRNWIHAGIAAAAVLVITLGVMTMILVARRAPTLVFQTSPGTEYDVTASADSPADRGTRTLDVGSNLEIHHGMVELHFKTGVRGVIRGPANITLQSEGLLHISQGTGWFDVPDKAVGFQVTTRDLTLTDLGTRFGVVASPELLDEVHVFEGRVEIVNRYGLKHAEVLTAGNARQVGSAGRWDEIPLYQGQFATELAITLPDLDLAVSHSSGPPGLDTSFGTFELALNCGTGGETERAGLRFLPVDPEGANIGTRGHAMVRYGIVDGIQVLGRSNSGEFSVVTLGDPEAADFDRLLHTQSTVSNGSDPLVLWIRGLEDRRRYQVQILFCEPRAGLIYDRFVTATERGGQAEVLPLAFGALVGKEHAVVTFEVEASSEIELRLPPSASRPPSIAGVVIHSRPAAASAR